jgi:hypothetical protein
MWHWESFVAIRIYNVCERFHQNQPHTHTTVQKQAMQINSFNSLPPKQTSIGKAA